jgi:hypothetical protein
MAFHPGSSRFTSTRESRPVAMKALFLLVVLTAQFWTEEPSYAASLSTNFTISTLLRCSNGITVPRTITRVGNHIFSQGTLHNSGSAFIVNRTTDENEPGAVADSSVFKKNHASASLSSEVTESSMTLREEVTMDGHIALNYITRVKVVAGSQSCEVNADFNSRSCRSISCSITNN